MQLGMVGLGRMGANIVRRLGRDGHECIAYDVDVEAIARVAAEGATEPSRWTTSSRSSSAPEPPG